MTETIERVPNEPQPVGVARELQMLLGLSPDHGEPPSHMDAAQIEQLELFRCRDGLSSLHVSELERGLLNDGELEPVLILRVGGRAFLIDGHHRLAAYQAVGRSEQVAIRSFSGSPSEAVLEGQKLNRKHTLAMTKMERMNAAWKLVKIDASGVSKHALADIVTNTAVSRAQVTQMRRVLRELGQDGHDHLQWYAALKDHQRKSQRTLTEEDIETMLDARAQADADKLVRALGTGPADNPELLARTLEYYCGRRVPALILELRERNPQDEDYDLENAPF